MTPEALAAIVASQTTGSTVGRDLATGELVTPARVVLTDGCDRHEEVRQTPIERVFDALFGTRP